MSSLRSLLIASTIVIPIVISLKCYVITPPQLITTTTLVGTETDCPANTLTCVKTLDQNAKTVSKSCGGFGQNCTGPNGLQNQPAQCNNQTATPFLNCCCYGDRCNSTSFTSIFVGLLFALLAVFQY